MDAIVDGKTPSSTVMSIVVKKELVWKKTDKSKELAEPIIL